MRWEKQCSGGTEAVAALNESRTDTASVCEKNALILNPELTEWLQCWMNYGKAQE